MASALQNSDAAWLATLLRLAFSTVALRRVDKNLFCAAISLLLSLSFVLNLAVTQSTSAANRHGAL